MEPETEEPCPLDEIRDRVAAAADLLATIDGATPPEEAEQIRARAEDLQDITDDDWRMAEGECDGCFWSSDEYTELTSYGPLFEFSLDYLRRRELGIEPKGLSSREESAVLFVNGELESGRARRLKKGSKHGEQGTGQDYRDIRR